MIEPMPANRHKTFRLTYELSLAPLWGEAWRTNVFYNLVPQIYTIFTTISEETGVDSQQAYEEMVAYYKSGKAEKPLPDFVLDFLEEAANLAEKPTCQRDITIRSFREHLML